MADNSSKFPAWFIFFVLFFLHVDCSSAEGKNTSHTCIDGTYEHGGATCCLCSAGMYVKEHCNTAQQGKCESCNRGTYSSHPNNEEFCEPCISCSHPNANLEVDEPCTRARNAKCRCKKDHYCSSGTETCKICYPCKECTEGIKVACTANNNTVCNDNIEGGNNAKMIVGITVPIVILVLGLGLGFALWKNKHKRDRRGKHTQVQLGNGSAEAHVEEMAAFNVPLQELEARLPDIAEAIGWRDMRDVARRSNVSNTIIEDCQRNHPGEAQEQTFELLQKWVERQGKDASKNLIQSLQRSGTISKAEHVISILNRPNLPA
ncbi:tumor necrosis factor receptor superfamily member 6-like [Cottoperca gobio]|uniref:Tumor necrosis factor receptor superfamily member 6-like n=1 Tax=Cottoperca gobio TaxID=56716 RepID=A0A6J2R4D6_COTGO|nr:tumor necrosis factor receptor superfamily member 6-like [Cottoperca gobio]